ncbi:MAG: DNA/RNA non-specific endonuclease [Pedobacter sp.]
MLDLLVVQDKDNGILDYMNYSVAMSKSHKLAFFSASNIDGLNFQNAPRKDRWRKDVRVGKYQWGMEFYGDKEAKFDRGHMTKREDVQWGTTQHVAMLAAESTFYYPNAVPQHKDLNRSLWKRLENYILNSETKKNSLRICVFSGPVLAERNPYFIKAIKGQSVQIPVLFWKVIVYPKSDGTLHRVGFIMSQNSLLIANGLIEELEIATDDDDLFLRFDSADTYQVNIQLIESMTGLTFPKAIDAYRDHRDTKLILKEVDIDPDLESSSLEQELGYSIENILL